MRRGNRFVLTKVKSKHLVAMVMTSYIWNWHSKMTFETDVRFLKKPRVFWLACDTVTRLCGGIVSDRVRVRVRIVASYNILFGSM